MYTSDYIAYFKYLATKHIDLQDSATSGSRVFAVVNQEAAMGDYRAGADTDGWIFRLVVPQWHLIENNGGLWSKDWLGGFIIARLFSAREDEDLAQFDILDDCDKIGEQFAGRIMRDCENGHSLFNYSVRSPQALQFKAQAKPLIADGYIGRLYTFRYQNNAKMCNNDTFWSDNGLTPF